jgi:ABC-type branched-subunit amino acid transport system substrate-binding protein
MRASVCLAVLLAACATTRARAQPEPGLPRPPDAAADVAPPDAGADADLQEAVTRFSRGDRGRARTMLEGWLVRHPDHARRVAAAALLARTALARGDAAGAKDTLQTYAPGSADPAVAFVMGVAESRLGHAAQALALLRPFEAGPPNIAGAVDDEAEPMLRVALAEALAATGDAVGALGEWDQYQRAPALRDHERAYARARAEELSAHVPGDVALRAIQGAAASLPRAVLAPRAAAALRARGDVDGARKLDDETTRLRRSLGFTVTTPWQGPGDPSRFGLAVPLSGALRVVGEVALRGALLALDDGTHTPPQPAQLLVRDTARAGDRPDRPMVELVRQEAVIGVLGMSGDRRAVDEASHDGVAFLALDEATPGRQTTAFQLLHGQEARAAELARRALALGARSFAVLGPDSASGKRLADAFDRAVTTGGGRMVVRKTYLAQATSFSAAVTELRRVPFDALFVPEDGKRLELVAPALAAGDLWPRAPGAAPRRTPGNPRREILLLSTATAVSRSLFRNVGRYVQGALLAPGFFASNQDPSSATFVTKFRQIYGQDPSAVDAYSFDGVRALRTAVEHGARTRADLLRMLATETFQGVTGALHFGPEHGRADAPVVYVVDGEDVRPLP